MDIRARVLLAGARQFKEVDEFHVYELSGADRLDTIELINTLNKQGEDHRVRNHFYVKLFVISRALLNDDGKPTFDVNEKADRLALGGLGPEFIDKLFNTASELSGLEWLSGKKSKKD